MTNNLFLWLGKNTVYKFIKNLLPPLFIQRIKKIISPPSKEYKWLKRTQRTLKNRIKKELIITKNEEFFLKSNFGFEFLIDNNEPHLRFDTFDDPNFKFLLEFLKKRLPKNAIFFDIGAFGGGYSLAFARYFPYSKIYAFEPVKDSFIKLNKNIIRNELGAVILPFQTAIGDNLDNVIMTNDQTTGNHIVSSNTKAQNVEIISSIDLDSFVNQQNIEKVDFIKCDVEGYEMAVLDGGKNLFTIHKPILYIEIVRKWEKRYGYTPEEILNKLISYGYQSYTITPNSIDEISNFSEISDDFENFLFISN